MIDSEEKTARKEVKKVGGGRLRNWRWAFLIKYVKRGNWIPDKNIKSHPPFAPLLSISSDWWKEHGRSWIFNESPLGPSTSSGLCKPLSLSREVLVLHFTQFKCALTGNRYLPVTSTSLSDSLSFTCLLFAIQWNEAELHMPPKCFWIWPTVNWHQCW